MRRRVSWAVVTAALLSVCLGFAVPSVTSASVSHRAFGASCATNGGVAYLSYDSGNAPTMQRCQDSAIFGVTEAPFNKAHLRGLLAELAAKVDTVSVYSAWGSCGASVSQCPVNQFIPTYTADPVAGIGAVPVITWESWNSTCTTQACEADYADANIAPGGIADPDEPGPFDSGIAAYARQVAAYGGPLFIRFDPEMDADQLPWDTIGKDGKEGDPNVDGIANAPDDYIGLWDHVRNVFAQNGALNVTWIWSPSVALGTGAQATEVADYPGNANVDMLGLDGYDWGTRGCGGHCVWITASGLFTHSIGYLNSLTGGIRPIWIAETAASEPTAADGAVSKAQWISDLGADFEQKSWSNVVGFSWFNYAPSGKNGEYFPFDCLTNAPPYECDGDATYGNPPPDPAALLAMTTLLLAWQTPSL